MSNEDILKEKIKSLKQEVKHIVATIGAKEAETIHYKEKRVVRTGRGVKFEKPKSYITHGILVEWKTGYTGYRKSLPPLKSLGNEVVVAITITEPEYTKVFKNFIAVVARLDKTWKRVSHDRIEKTVRL